MIILQVFRCVFRGCILLGILNDVLTDSKGPVRSATTALSTLGRMFMNALKDVGFVEGGPTVDAESEGAKLEIRCRVVYI